MDLSSAKELFKVASSLAGVIPVVGTQLGGAFAAAESICGMLESAQSNREGFKQLGIDIAGYMILVGRAVQTNHAPSTEQPDPGAPNAVEMRSSLGQNHQLEQTRQHIAEFAESLDKVKTFLSESNNEDQKGSVRPLGRFRPLLREVFQKGKNEEKLSELREMVKSTVTKFHISSDIAGLEALDRLVEDMQEVRRAQDEMRETQRKMEQVHNLHLKETRDVQATQKKMAHVQQVHAEETRDIRDAQKKMDQVQGVHVEKTREVQELQKNMEQRQQWSLLTGTLAPTHAARHDGDGTISTCLPNTRVELLAKLIAWAKDPILVPILWLSGLAGTGKTTVAKTVCEQLSGSMKVVSFFISRHFNDRKTSGNVLNSLVYQLGNCDPLLKRALVAAYENDPDIASRPLAKKVAALVEEPLKKLNHVSPPIVVVIDALDECDMEFGREGGQLLPLLAGVARRLPNAIRLFITSREEPTIKSTFEEMKSAHNDHATVRLHMIEEHIVSSDIQHFFLYRLRDIAKRLLGLTEAEWPLKEDIAELVRRAGVLFVYAATVIRFLDDPDFNPQTRLGQILDERSKSSDDRNPYGVLDALYLEVLNKAVRDSKNKDDALCIRVRLLVNALVLLQHPLDPISLSQLLDIDIYSINVDVRKLSAVLMVPDAPTDTVKLFHLSFPDYVLRRCDDERFTINPGTHHAFILRRCIAVMKQYLKQDICEIGDASLLNSEVADLPERIGKFLPSALRYACQHWIVHLSHSSLDNNFINELEDFCSRHLLHWVESLSLLDGLLSAVRNLSSTLEWCKEHLPSQHIVTSLFSDAERLMRQYFTPLSVAALQVYETGLTFMPVCSLCTRATQTEKFRRGCRLVTEQFAGWGPLLRAIDGHIRSVLSVGFSPDGKRAVSGSRDEMVRISDVATGETIAILQGHTRSVNSVEFSLDGRHVVSGSLDNTVRIWSVATGRSIKTLKGHTSSVNSVGFSPNGKRIVSGSFDGTARIWDVATGQPITILKGHTSSVNSVGFSPRDEHVVSGSYDKTVRTWNASTGKTTATLHGHTSSVNSVRFSPNGKRIVSGSDDKTVRIWDVATSEAIAKLEGHTSSVNSVRFSPDGRQVASGSDDEAIRLWNITIGKATMVLKGHASSVNSVAFSFDSKHVVSGSSDKTMRIWSVVTSEATATLKGHTQLVNSVEFSPEGTYIASGSFDKTVRIWNVATGKATKKLEGHTSPVTSVGFSPDSKHIASGSQDKTVRVWNVVASQQIMMLQGHTNPVESVSFSPDGKHIVSGSWDKTVRIWEVATGQATATLHGHTRLVRSVSFSPHGKHIVSGSHDKMVRIWDVPTSRATATPQGHTKPVLSAGFSPDGKYAASGSSDKTVQIWDVAAGQPIMTLKGHTGPVNSVGFSPDGKRVVSGSDDQMVKMWNVATGLVTATLHNHLSSVSSVGFSPDGKRVVSGSNDKTIQIWKVATGQVIATLHGHISSVTSVVFSPDGKYILSGSDDKTVRIWDVATRKTIATLRDHVSSVNSVGFSPDGKRIVSGSSDKTLQIWDVATGQPITTLQGHKDSINAVGFSSDGKRIVSGSSDRSLWLWDVATSGATAMLQGHTSLVRSVEFSPDGKHVVSGSDDETVRIWSVATGQTTATLEGHTDPVTSVKFSPDGAHIFSRDLSGTERTWNASKHFLLTHDLTDESALQTVAVSSPSLISFSFDSSGWLYIRKNVGDQPRRLCWVPIDRRPSGNLINSFEHMVILGSSSGILTLLSYISS